MMLLLVGVRVVMRACDFMSECVCACVRVCDLCLSFNLYFRLKGSMLSLYFVTAFELVLRQTVGLHRDPSRIGGKYRGLLIGNHEANTYDANIYLTASIYY